MNKDFRLLTLPEGKYEMEVLIFDEADRVVLREIYNDWRALCVKLNTLDARGVNLPEGLSESSFCLEMNCVRTSGGTIKAKNKKINTSFDAYDLNRKKRIQIKACSVLPDLTSFGPKSVWDELYFVDFYRQGEWDGKFDIYKIETDHIRSCKVNSTQSFTDQQEEKRRPRFSIYSAIIQEQNILPIRTGNLYT
jgi:hypothetical protein